jgi:NADPH:quinone reductase-like Zn-dependent oxidoreductase
LNRCNDRKPNDDEALVRVIASSVNPADPLTLSGKICERIWHALAADPGYDIAGVVEKTGRECYQAQSGRRDLRLSNFWRRLGGLRDSQGMGSRSETEVPQFFGSGGRYRWVR